MLRLILIATTGLVAFFAIFFVAYWIIGNNDVAAVAGLVFGAMGIPVLLLHVWRPAGSRGLDWERSFVAVVDGPTVTVTRPDGETERVSLAELREVAIVTDHSGPWAADVWWQLIGPREESRCSFPGGATGEDAVLRAVQRLPGFDNETFMNAMASTSSARFSCWRAADAARPATGAAKRRVR